MATSTRPSGAVAVQRGPGQAGDEHRPADADLDGHRARALEQGVGRPGDHEPPAVDHHDVVAHPLHVVEQVGGHEHGDAERPSRATSASISSRPSGSSPAVGSSSRTSSGSATSAWASLVRWRMPVEKPPIGRKRASSSPTRSRTSDARWRAARAGSPPSSPNVATRRRPPSGRAAGSRARACSRAGSARRSGRRRRRCPQTSIVPSVGWASPSSRRNSVVLPAPLAPTSPTRPRGTSTVRPSRAVRPGSAW